MKFLKLFSPLKVGNMVLSNRIVMPAVHLNMADKGFVTDQLNEFYAERARGGVGLIVVGGCYVSPYAVGITSMIGMDHDKFLPKLKEFTGTVHAARPDVKIGAQLYHSGRYSPPQLLGEAPISASAVYSIFSRATPREMTLEDIKREINAFGDAAARAEKAGFDCVEISGSAGYLINQFLSPLTNKRKDQYGGDLENRLRFPLEVIKSVKSNVSTDFTVGMRVAGDDFMGEESSSYKDHAVYVKHFESAGIDFLSVTGGWHETKIPQLTMDVPEGAYTYLAENVKRNVSIPVFSANRINNPTLAEQILMAEKSDAVCIGRGLIADPYLPKKAKNGELHDIMHCVACNQGCFDEIFSMKPVKCLRNARAGREASTKLNPVSQKKKVMVVGSGPGGLEVARVASMRGHDVLLFEKEDKIGGLLNLIHIPPGRSEFKRIIDDYSYWFTKYGVSVHYKKEVNLDVVKEVNPDAVVIATGTTPIKVPIPGINNEHVYWANDALNGDVPIGNNNVVIGGGATGIELAIYLAKYGRMNLDAFDFLTRYKALELEDAFKMIQKGTKKVTVLEKLPRCGANLGKTTKWVLMDKCTMLGVKIETSVNVVEIKNNQVIYADSTEAQHVIDNVDAIYYATGVKSNDSLFEEIKTSCPDMNVEKVGDARKVATVLEAVEMGYEIGNNL
ncbi:MAG: FAD-dependent oxidoreductase [Candidatus Lokiarchaeota archaeon]|nr:FAD-dependent oxidoreductase [Candidatus Lokiarchaeota archaeon]